MGSTRAGSNPARSDWINFLGFINDSSLSYSCKNKWISSSCFYIEKNRQNRQFISKNHFFETLLIRNIWQLQSKTLKISNISVHGSTTLKKTLKSGAQAWVACNKLSKIWESNLNRNLKTNYSWQPLKAFYFMVASPGL